MFGKGFKLEFEVFDKTSKTVVALAKNRLQALKIAIKHIRSLTHERNALEAQILALKDYIEEERYKNDQLIRSNLELLEKVEKSKELTIEDLTNELTEDNLYEVIRLNQSISKSDLCGLFDVSYPTLQTRIDSLEERGLLKYENRKFIISS